MTWLNDVVFTGGVLAVNVDESRAGQKSGFREMCAMAKNGTLPGLLGTVRNGSFSAWPTVASVGEKYSAFADNRLHPVQRWDCTLKGKMENISPEVASSLMPGSVVETENGFSRVVAGTSASSPRNAAWIGETARGSVMALVKNPVSTGGFAILLKGETGEINFEYQGFGDGDTSPFELYILEE